MERIVVNNVSFLQGNTHIDDFLDHTVCYDQSFSRKELGSFFQLIYLELSPKSLHLFHLVVGIKP